MKKTLLSLAFISSALFVSAQTLTPGLSDVAAYDDFATADPYGVLTEDTKWNDVDSIPAPGEFAFKGILWGSTAVATPTRAGDGKVAYKINQAEGAYEPFVVLFGTYADGAAKKFYTIDLSSDANLSFSIKNADATIVRVSVQVQDINDVTLAFTAAASATGAKFYEHQLGFVQGESDPLAANSTGDYTVDLKTAIVGEGADKTTISATGNSTFDYTKVKMILITVVQDANTGDPNYAPLALVDYPVEVSNFKIGDVSTITGLQDNFLAENGNQVVSVYDMMGKFVAAGKLNTLGLESGKLYVVKSGNKSRKIVMN